MEAEVPDEMEGVRYQSRWGILAGRLISREVDATNRAKRARGEEGRHRRTNLIIERADQIRSGGSEATVARPLKKMEERTLPDRQKVVTDTHTGFFVYEGQL